MKVSLNDLDSDEEDNFDYVRQMDLEDRIYLLRKGLEFVLLIDEEHLICDRILDLEEQHKRLYGDFYYC